MKRMKFVISGVRTYIEGSMNLDLKKIRDEVNLVVKKSTKDRLQAAVGEKYQISEVDNPKKNQVVFAPKMAIILVSGDDLQITLKACFYTDEIQQVVSKVHGTKEEEVKSSLINDFMQEYCNLVAGKIKHLFVSSSISVGISLPFITRGFDQIIDAEDSPDLKHQDWWTLKFNNEGSVTLISTVELRNPVALESLSFDSLTEIEDESDEISFF